MTLYIIIIFMIELLNTFQFNILFVGGGFESSTSFVPVCYS